MTAGLKWPPEVGAPDRDGGHQPEAECKRHGQEGDDRAALATGDHEHGRDAERPEEHEDESADRLGGQRADVHGCLLVLPRAGVPGRGLGGRRIVRAAVNRDGCADEQRVAPRPAEHLDQLEPIDGLLDGLADRDGAVALEEHRARKRFQSVHERGGDPPGELVAARRLERHEWQSRQQQRGLRERRRVRHLACERQRHRGRQVRMDDCTHVGARRVDGPMDRDVGARPGIGRGLRHVARCAVERDLQDVLAGELVLAATSGRGEQSVAAEVRAEIALAGGDEAARAEAAAGAPRARRAGGRSPRAGQGSDCPASRPS